MSGNYIIAYPVEIPYSWKFGSNVTLIGHKTFANFTRRLVTGAVIQGFLEKSFFPGTFRGFCPDFKQFVLGFSNSKNTYIR